MVEIKKWVFEGYCPRNSKLGVLLAFEVANLKVDDREVVDDVQIRRGALIGLGKRVGLEIKADDFLALGPLEYFKTTEIGRVVMPKLRDYYDRKCMEVQLLNLARMKAKSC